VITEITTNKEKSNKRKLDMNGNVYFLRRSKIKIDKDNCDAVKVLDVLNRLDKSDMNESAFSKILSFAKESGIKKETLLDKTQIKEASKNGDMALVNEDEIKSKSHFNEYRLSYYSEYSNQALLRDGDVDNFEELGFLSDQSS
jgi:hypothetical protein